MPLFSKIAILGPGLIGGSLLLGARERKLSEQLSVWGRSSSSLEEIRQAGIDCSLHTSVAEALYQAEMVILCVPIGAMRSVLEQGLAALSPQAVVTDVGSVKLCVVQELEPLLAGRAHWVGSHPMAGRELTGFSAARPTLFDGATTILTPTPLTTPLALERAHAFWDALGSRTIELAAEEHDRLVAEISHLPHLVAAALVQAVSPASYTLAGSGFRDTTRVASGPPSMWKEILLTNRTAVGHSLDQLISILQTTRQALAGADSQTILDLLTRANEVRQKIVKS